MKELDVTYFSTLLNLDAEAVNAAEEEGSIGEKIKALNLLSSDQVTTLKENHSKEVKSGYFTELVDKAKRGELDQELYKPVHGAVYEMLEKDLVKDYKIERGSLKEMIAKISNKGQSNDTDLALLNEKIAQLQGINENLVKEKEEAVVNAKSEYDGKLISRDKTDKLRSIPFDFSDVEEDKLEQRKTSTMQILSDVFDARFSLGYDGDKLVVMDKEKKVLTDNATLTPLPVLDVMKELATELNMKLTSLETGGQGGNSSGGNGTAAFSSKAEYDEYCVKKGINPHSSEGIKLWSDRRPKTN